MKTNNIKFYYTFFVLFVILLCFSFSNVFSAATINNFLTADDSLSNVSVASQEIDSSTFGYHFYQRKLFGEHDLIYKNFGAVIDFKKSDDGFMESGFEKFYPLLFIVEKPITSTSSSFIKYVTGTKTEQVFCAGFNQAIFKRFMMMGNFRSIVSPGFFQNQSSKIQNYDFGLLYKSKNELYQATVNYNYSKAQLGENGGIKTDSSLQKISNNQGNGLSINLADTKINLKRNRFRLVQSLNFNRKVIDTISQGNNFLSLRSISHTSSYERFVFLYSGSTINSDFYNNSYYDSIRTYDSLFISRINNALNFSFNAGSNGSGIDVFYKNEIIQYNMHENNIDLIIHHAGTSYNYYGENLSGVLLFDYRYSDYLKEAMSLNARLEKKFTAPLNSIFVEVDFENQYPALTSRSFISNHFVWQNDFKNCKIGMLNAGLSFADDILKLKFSGRNINDYIYYNTNGLPVQFTSDLKIFTADVTVKYNFLRNWNLYNESTLSSTDKEEVYAVPGFTSYTSIFYERFYFKKAMKASIGAGCLYFTSYFANAFMPATAQFQRQQIQEIGNYPYVDFFVNMRIKSVKLFLKIEHLNMGMSNGQYFYLPHQPTPGRTLKLGIDWTFSEDLQK